MVGVEIVGFGETKTDEAWQQALAAKLLKDSTPNVPPPEQIEADRAKIIKIGLYAGAVVLAGFVTLALSRGRVG